jgi:hypothetical protein
VAGKREQFQLVVIGIAYLCCPQGKSLLLIPLCPLILVRASNRMKESSFSRPQLYIVSQYIIKETLKKKRLQKEIRSVECF